MKPRQLKARKQRDRSRQRKFRKGAPVNSVELLAGMLNAGDWLMWNGRPMHPEFIRSMTLRGIERGVLSGAICRAESSIECAPLPLPLEDLK